MTATKRVLVDSSGWVEAIGNGPKASLLDAWITGNEPLVMPTIVIYEVTKKLLSSPQPAVSDRFYSHALRQLVVPLDEHIASAAARASLQHRLPMADAIIYTTAQAFSAMLVTTDAHFTGLAGVTVL
jgi:predicted nucleic acid-binding protein